MNMTTDYAPDSNAPHISGSPSQIETELKDLRNRGEVIHKLLSELSQRLRVVCRDAIPRDAAASLPKEVERLVPLAAQIRDCNRGFVDAAVKIRDLLDRIDLPFDLQKGVNLER